MIGDTLTCTTTPADATVTYLWQYGTATMTTIGSTASVVVPDGALGQPITLTVTGVGEYAGTVSDTTAGNVTVKATSPGDHQAGSAQTVSTTITAGSLDIGLANLLSVHLKRDGVIDRDLVPETEFIGTQGSIKRIDFLPRLC